MAVAVDGREPQLVVLEGGTPVMPSAVFADRGGTLFVGQEAERQAAVDPSRYEPNPKRRIDEGQLLLGDTVLNVLDVVRAVLVRATGEARRLVGGARIDLLVLTHPADWGAVRTRILRQAGQGLGTEVSLVPEPVAAAVFHSASTAMPDGTALAVLDFGGGTVDASVVRRRGASFEVLATRGEPNFGGADIDQALLEHVGTLVSAQEPEAWQALVEGREMADRRRRRVLRQDVRGAKETLSRHAYTDVPMPTPFPDAHVTRADLERLIGPQLGRAADLVADTVKAARLTPGELSTVFLVGGSSRIPLVARLVHERVGVLPTTLDQPETVVARGALRVVTLDPHRTGAFPGVRPPSPMQQPLETPSPGYSAVPVGGAGPMPAGAAEVTHPVQPSNFPQVPAPVAVRRKSKWLPWIVVGSVVVVIAAAVTVFRLVTGGPEGKPVAQYDYRFTAPPGWSQIGGDAANREVQLKPDGSTGQDLIAVQERALDYDATVQRDLAISQVRSAVDKAGSAFSGFSAATSFGGKDVVHYRQQVDGATVDWYVVLKGKAQVSVGCQYPAGDQDTMRAACQQVVSTLAVDA
ncbi:type VII secretion-associated protein (TIGR03931 family) [Kutzneria buriramensis]|uniref:Type VII secretion-associated protein (TIGR03931 family) n=1 Tax=Kutzneria buriramensis TaxID=1045776 RepID=A0A3E0I9Y5_9PSEU|nr:type VII secretion-associated protein (TIGR03931 family) [Kutzneria buriramensis]